MRQEVTDIRCPLGTSLLLRILSTDSKLPIEFVDSHLLQLHCKECSREFRRISGTDNVQRVLHVFTTSGDFKHTTIQFKDGADRDISLADQIALFDLSSRFVRGS